GNIPATFRRHSAVKCSLTRMRPTTRLGLRVRHGSEGGIRAGSYSTVAQMAGKLPCAIALHCSVANARRQGSKSDCVTGGLVTVEQLAAFAQHAPTSAFVHPSTSTVVIAPHCTRRPHPAPAT